MAISDEMGFTCRDILHIPHLKDAIVRAGRKGLHRLVTRVNIMEVPDVINWVRPGELLVTTGFPYRERPEELAEMIPQLVEKGVAALGIKPHRFIERIPERVLELADRYEFPIFELPPTTVFSDVVREVMERVLVREARQLSLLQSRFQQMSNQLLHGKGIEDFIHQLDEMLNNPLVLIDNAGRLIVSPQAEPLAERLQISDVWPGSRDEMKLGNVFITLGDRQVRTYVSGEEGHYLLLLLEWNQELTVVDQLTVDRVGILISLEMLNAKARWEVEAKYIDQFLQDWMAGRIVTAADLKLRAEACGCPIEDLDSFQVVIVRWHKGKPANKQLHKTMGNMGRLKFNGYDIHVVMMDDELTFLISRVAGSGGVHLDSILQQFSLELSAVSPSGGGKAFSYCVGKIVNVPQQVNQSYEQAHKIYRISEICGLRHNVIGYDKLGAYQLLYLLPNCEEVREFRDRLIEPLLEYDRKNSSILIDTLKAYFRNNESLKRTANELFTHYNTILYRIERAYDLLKLDVNDGNDRLQLHLAIKLYEMTQQKKEDGSR